MDDLEAVSVSDSSAERAASSGLILCEEAVDREPRQVEDRIVEPLREDRARGSGLHGEHVGTRTERERKRVGGVRRSASGLGLRPPPPAITHIHDVPHIRKVGGEAACHHLDELQGAEEARE